MGRSSLPVRLARIALKIGIVVMVVYAMTELLEWAADRAEMANSPETMFGIFAILLIVYALLIAIPFMPGIEVGITLLMLKGASIAPLVYAATMLGLLIAYAVGRLIPPEWVRGFLDDLRLTRVSSMIDRYAPLSGDDRMALMTRNLPKWLAPVVQMGRYVTLGVLLNIPGNALIGGGGGIAFVAGFSKLFRPSLTILIIAIAVLPVPLAVYLGGTASLR
ncbi:hypothetical protein N9L47_02845 [Rhodobacteraceae bacterium]|nr:hypothetical protein [Paracoccaceae bacterium]